MFFMRFTIRTSFYVFLVLLFKKGVAAQIFYEKSYSDKRSFYSKELIDNIGFTVEMCQLLLNFEDIWTNKHFKNLSSDFLGNLLWLAFKYFVCNNTFFMAIEFINQNATRKKSIASHFHPHWVNYIINSFSTNAPLLYLLKTSENWTFSDVFRE